MSDSRSEIERLIFQYAHTFDRGDLDAFAELFAHGTLTLRGLAKPATGKTEVRELMDRLVILYDGSPRTNHIMSNMLIDVNDATATATGKSYVQILHALPGGPIQIIATGLYEDTFHCVDGTWQFAERTATGSLLGDMSNHVHALQ
jgi:hypothetical protein